MEGPSLVILKEEFRPVVGKTVLGAAGNSKQIRVEELPGRKLLEVHTWGKHLLLRFGRGLTLKIHFLMFGSYTMDLKKPGRDPRLTLRFPGHAIHFYSCSVRELEGDPREVYDYATDPMSPEWDELRAVRAVRGRPGEMVCDVLLDQEIFSGVGNIIKNEVLYRLGILPLTRVGELTLGELRALVRETRRYCFEFYEWKKRFVLRKNWKIYRQK
ncbi:MAG TPA: DNA-formamidopyrimidine glycosylase family protein, partial [Bdellovibrionota bacterium]|nr:DNA-formamidopyrimidine glycosylase family protein [Bdellovibrionota bacterium]